MPDGPQRGFINGSSGALGMCLSIDDRGSQPHDCQGTGARHPIRAAYFVNVGGRPEQPDIRIGPESIWDYDYVADPSASRVLLGYDVLANGGGSGEADCRWGQATGSSIERYLNEVSLQQR